MRYGVALLAIGVFLAVAGAGWSAHAAGGFEAGWTGTYSELGCTPGSSPWTGAATMELTQTSGSLSGTATYVGGFVIGDCSAPQRSDLHATITGTVTGTNSASIVSVYDNDQGSYEGTLALHADGTMTLNEQGGDTATFRLSSPPPAPAPKPSPTPSVGKGANSTVSTQLPTRATDYYTYCKQDYSGKKGTCSNTWGTGDFVHYLESLAAQWHAAHPGVPLGIGDLSQQGGGKLAGHTTGHQIGINADIRAIRTDDKPVGVLVGDPRYDPAATAQLVNEILTTPAPNGLKVVIFFNDPRLKGQVCYLGGHTDHMHVQLSVPGYKCTKPWPP